MARVTLGARSRTSEVLDQHTRRLRDVAAWLRHLVNVEGQRPAFGAELEALRAGAKLAGFELEQPGPDPSPFAPLVSELEECALELERDPGATDAERKLAAVFKSAINTWRRER